MGEGAALSVAGAAHLLAGLATAAELPSTRQERGSSHTRADEMTGFKRAGRGSELRKGEHSHSTEALFTSRAGRLLLTPAAAVRSQTISPSPPRKGPQQWGPA